MQSVSDLYSKVKKVDMKLVSLSFDQQLYFLHHIPEEIRALSAAGKISAHENGIFELSPRISEHMQVILEQRRQKEEEEEVWVFV